MYAPSEKKPASVKSRVSGLTERKIPDNIRSGASKRLGVDLSGAKAYESSNLEENVGDVSVTQGSNIFLQKGRFSLDSKKGKHMLNHELTHVAQQGTGLARGSGPLFDQALESQADKGVLGTGAASFSAPSAESAPIQGLNFKELLKKGYEAGKGFIQKDLEKGDKSQLKQYGTKAVDMVKGKLGFGSKGKEEPKKEEPKEDTKGEAKTEGKGSLGMDTTVKELVPMIAKDREGTLGQLDNLANNKKNAPETKEEGTSEPKGEEKETEEKEEGKKTEGGEENDEVKSATAQITEILGKVSPENRKKILEGLSS